VREDAKEGIKTLLKHVVPGYGAVRTYKITKKRTGDPKTALKHAARDAALFTTPFGIAQAGVRAYKDWKKKPGEKYTQQKSTGKFTGLEGLEEGWFSKEKKPSKEYIWRKKKIEQRLKAFGITPGTEAERNKQANKDLKALKQQLSMGEEYIMNCPHCNEEFFENDVELYEDRDGQFVICPFCEEDIDLVEEEKEFTMNEQVFGEILENVQHLNEEDIDDFVDSLNEEEVDQMLEFVEILESLDFEDEDEGDVGDLAEDIIESIVSGETSASEMADIIAGIEE